jgi:hypothetical protein
MSGYFLLFLAQRIILLRSQNNYLELVIAMELRIGSVGVVFVPSSESLRSRPIKYFRWINP